MSGRPQRERKHERFDEEYVQDEEYENEMEQLLNPSKRRVIVHQVPSSSTSSLTTTSAVGAQTSNAKCAI